MGHAARPCSACATGACSRQRYWGTPIPIIHCDACGAVPVPRDQLPVVLPEDVCFDIPGNPLDRHPTWKNVDCPSCGGKARRETDTLDTFVDSSWYFIRFASQPGNAPFDRAVAEKWLPVGAIYRRRRACDPAPALCAFLDPGAAPYRHARRGRALCRAVHPGHGDARDSIPRGMKAASGSGTGLDDVAARRRRRPTLKADGAPVAIGRVEKMSKSKKNTVDPTGIVDQYGADAVRWFMLSDSPPERDLPWSEAGIEGAGASSSGCGGCSTAWPKPRRATRARHGARPQDAPDHRRRRRRYRGAVVQQGGRQAVRAGQRDRDAPALGLAHRTRSAR